MEPARWLGLTIAGLLHLSACATVEPPQVRDARLSRETIAGGPAVSQLELQQSIQRFTGEFIDRVTQSFEGAKAADPKLHALALRRLLLYGSSALDIASGPQPELNVLDMLVFVSLSRLTLESHWVPRVFGVYAKPVVEAFAQSESSLWMIADRIMSEPQQAQVRELIRAWRAAHAGQVRVEWIRFQDFSVEAEGAARDRANAARGLLGALRSASQAADQAVMLGERAMFVAHRLPFVLRLQARVGAHETLDDSLHLLDDHAAIRERTAQLTAIVAAGQELARSVETATREGRLLYHDLQPLLRSLDLVESEDGARQPVPSDLSKLLQVLEASNQLATQSSSVLRELRSVSAPIQSGELRSIDDWLDRFLQRCLLYLGLLGAAWAACFWGAYYLAKRAIAPRSRPRDSIAD